MSARRSGAEAVAQVHQTVLLVAPETMLPRPYQAVLARPGLTLLHAANLPSAVAILPEQDLSLIILEPLPGALRPDEACRQLHRDQAARAVPILCLQVDDPLGLQAYARRCDPPLIEVLAPSPEAAPIEQKIAVLLERDAGQRRLAQAQQEWMRSARHAETILGAVGEGIIRLSTSGRIAYANPAALAMLGGERDALHERPFHLFFPLQGETDSVWQYTPFFHSWLAGVEQTVEDAFFRKLDGERFPVAFRCTPMPVPEDGVLVVFEDLSFRRQLEARLRRQAILDSLTGLTNRDGFKQALEQAIDRARVTSTVVALLSIDLDRFTRINDTLGHETGDAILQAVARRLQECVGEHDLVARTGGDEFAIVLADLSASGHGMTMAERTLASLRRPFAMADGLDITIGASIGIATYPDTGMQADAILRCAEVAMHQAKTDGRNQALTYLPEMNSRAGGRMALEQALRVAVDERSFTLDYQPQVDLANGNVVGFEALLRWERDGFGRVSPAKFVPMLEETGLIVPVGRWIFESGCRQRQRWADQLPDTCTISVNLSPRQFTDKRLAAQIRHILEVNQLPAYRLEIELTESMLMLDREYTHGVLQSLKDMGLKLSVDDFGTGYSSLAYLKLFALDALKIDKQFIDQITTSTRDAAIATSIIQLGHNLGLEVVAEGVETLEQVNLLRELGCDVVQGYYFGQPLPADEVTSFPHRMRMH